MSSNSTQWTNRNILQIVQKVQETICKKQLIESSTSLLLSISGGQDSIFLLFCLSFLQTQISFTFKAFWCNHFWQIDSFYTTLHLTKYAVNFSFPLITFIPLHDFSLKSWDIDLENKQVKLYESFPNFVEPLSDVSLFFQFPRSCLATREFATQTLATQGKRTRSPRTRYARICSPRTRFANPCDILLASLAANAVREYHQGDTAHSVPRVREGLRTAFACLATQGTSKLSHSEVRGISKGLRTAFAVSKLSRTAFAASEASETSVRVCVANSRVPRSRRARNSITAIHVKEFGFFHLDNVGNSSFKKFLPLRRQSWQISRNYVPCKKIEDLSSENIARNWRHITTERSSSFYTLEKTIYGHTLSDKIETIIFNLIRGAGRNGITPLSWKRKTSKFSYNKFYCSFERIQKNTHLDCI